MKIEYLITVYQEDLDTHRLALLQMVVRAAMDIVRQFKNQMQIVFLVDIYTSTNLIRYLMYWTPGHNCRFFTRTSGTVENLVCERGIFEYMKQSKADYVFLNHSDDIPRPNRVESQIKVMEKHPTIPMCLAGYRYHDDKLNEHYDNYFRLNPDMGLNVGYPSCWAFNLKVPQITINWEEMLSCRSHFDTLYLYHTLKNAPIIAMKQPLVDYYFHGVDVDIRFFKKSQLNQRKIFQQLQPLHELIYVENEN